MAYAQVEPFGETAAFWRAGMVASVLANVNRPKKGQKAFKPEDFMPKEPKDATQEDTWETMLKQAKAITDMLGGSRGDAR